MELYDFQIKMYKYTFFYEYNIYYIFFNHLSYCSAILFFNLQTAFIFFFLQSKSMMYESTCSYQSALDLKRVAMSSPPNIKTENDCLPTTTPQWPSVGVASCAYR